MEKAAARVRELDERPVPRIHPRHIHRVGVPRHEPSVPAYVSGAHEALGPRQAIRVAKILGITWHMLSRILNDQAEISPEMAVRLEKAFDGTAQSWLALQQAYDLAQVEQGKIKVRRAAVLKEVRNL